MLWRVVFRHTAEIIQQTHVFTKKHKSSLLAVESRKRPTNKSADTQRASYASNLYPQSQKKTKKLPCPSQVARPRDFFRGTNRISPLVILGDKIATSGAPVPLARRIQLERQPSVHGNARLFGGSGCGGSGGVRRGGLRRERGGTGGSNGLRGGWGRLKWFATKFQ